MAEFERLTNHSARAAIQANDVDCTHFNGVECQRVSGYCMNCTWYEKVWERLAAYEDTGLSPEQVSDMKSVWRGLDK